MPPLLPRPDIYAGSAAPQQLQQATAAGESLVTTPDLFLKHIDEIFAIYV
jgi:hypothetical protein